MIRFFARCFLVHIVLLISGSLLLSPGSFTRAQSASQADSPKAAAQQSLPLKQRIEIFEQVWGAVNEKYYDPKFNGADWQAAHDKYRPQVERVAGEADFYDLLNAMLGELRDAHTRARSPRQRQERRNQQATTAGVVIYEVENKTLVVMVAPGSDADKAGVLPGMLVRTINDRQVGEALAEARREVGTSSSDRADKLFAYSRIIRGEPDTILKLGLTRADGTDLDVTLTRRIVSVTPNFETRLLLSGIAYIKFDRFAPPVGKQIKEALIKYKDAPGLILDLRANPGGDGELGLEIGGYFFNDKVPVARLLTRTGKPPSVLFGLISFPKEFSAGEKGKQLYAQPLVVLTNDGTASTSELFAGVMQEQGRAKIIGTQSCGCVLGILKYRELKDGGDLGISEIGFMTAKGNRLEGAGITPDIRVMLKIADLQNNQDQQLKEAENYLTNLNKKD